MKVRFLAPAQSELDDAVAWYNEQAAGLGLEFLEKEWFVICKCGKM